MALNVETATSSWLHTEVRGSNPTARLGWIFEFCLVKAKIICFMIYVFVFSFETSLMIWNLQWKGKPDRHYHTLTTMRRVSPLVKRLIRHIWCGWWLTRAVLWKVVYISNLLQISICELYTRNSPGSTQVLLADLFHSKLFVFVVMDFLSTTTTLLPMHTLVLVLL